MITAIIPESTVVFMIDLDVRLLSLNVHRNEFKQYFLGGKINRKCLMKVLNLGRFYMLQKSYIAIYHFKSATFGIKFLVVLAV